MGKILSGGCDLNFDRIFVEHACNKDSHKISDEFDIGPRTIHFGVTPPCVMKLFPIGWRKCCREGSAFTFNRMSSLLQVTRTAMKSRTISNFGQIRHFRVSKKTIFVIVRSLFRLNQIFMRLADNQDRHKISNKFEFRPDRTSDLGVTCPLVPKNIILDLVQTRACLMLTESL